MPAPLPDATVLGIAATLKAVADPNRVKLMHRIASAGTDGVCVCELTAPLGISQPSVSYHLRILREAGLVDRRQEGTYAFYSARADAFEQVGHLLGAGDVLAAW